MDIDHSEYCNGIPYYTNKLNINLTISTEKLYINILEYKTLNFLYIIKIYEKIG